MSGWLLWMGEMVGFVLSCCLAAAIVLAILWGLFACLAISVEAIDKKIQRRKGRK